MKRKIVSGLMLAGVALMGTGFVSCVDKAVSGQGAATQAAPAPVADQAEAPHPGEGGVPMFERDPSWPKVPAKWKLGDVSSASADAQDNIWVIHRPRTLPENQRAMAAPAILQFDNAGNFLQGWGGEGAGYEWPMDEHSVHVDYKGFVWILGALEKQDAQILKFTKDGKFVMQIGKRGQFGGNATQNLNAATGIDVYPKTNELFISDGYENSRVMVYDADTGTFKRMWGAYGNKPLDPGARPKRFTIPADDHNFFDADGEHFVNMLRFAEDLQQFNTAHDVGVSNDGLVYLADRGNKRVQVFTLDGTFIKEQFININSIERLQARSTAFSPDPQQKFLFVAGNPEIFILNRRTLEVLGAIETGKVQRHPPNHHIASDGKGNVYTMQAAQTGADGKGGGVGIQKFVYKGLSPATAAGAATTQ